MTKAYSPACERNRDAIVDILQDKFADCRRVLEVGSGTGQHAVHFAAAMPWLQWQASDRGRYLPGIRAWLDEANLDNTPAPLCFDVNGEWPAREYDGLFSANTLHIMAWHEVEQLFAGLPRLLARKAELVIYGPFRYHGQHTSDSNAAFDASLRAQSPQMGVRDFAAVNALAEAAGFQLIVDHEMPANNRCLVWRREVS